MRRKLTSGRKRWHRFGVKAKSGRRSLSAYYTWGEYLQDGETNVSTLQTNNQGLTSMVSQGVLLYGLTDLGTTSAGSKVQRAKITGLHAMGHVLPDEDSTEHFGVNIMTWLMACPGVVFTDWITNNRTPQDPALAGIVTANPFRILCKPQIRAMWTGPAVNRAQQVARFNMRAVRSFTVPYPWQVYLMFGLNTLHDDTTAGVPNAAMSLTYNFGGKIYQPNNS